MKKLNRYICFSIFLLFGYLALTLYYSMGVGQTLIIAAIAAVICLASISISGEYEKRDLLSAALIAAFWSYSTYHFGSEQALSLIGLLGIIMIFTYYFFLFFFIIHLFGSLNQKVIRIDSVERSKKYSFIKYFFPLLFVWGVILIGVYPGILTADSYNQWTQVMGLVPLNAWHPLIHTFTIKLFSIFSDTPFIFLCAQVIFGASLVSGLMIFLERRGLSVSWRLVIFAFYLLYPVNGMYMATLWKDIPYSLFLLWFAYLIFRCTEEKVVGNQFLKKNQILIIIVSFMTMEFRKNGVLVVIATMLIVAILIRNRLWWKTLLIVLFCHFGFVGVTQNILGAIPGPKYEAMSIPLQQIAATFHENGTISESDKEYFEKILPLEKWENNYNPKTVDAIKFDSEFNGQVIEENIGVFLRHWENMLKPNFAIYVKAYLEQSASLWRYHQPEGYQVYVETDVSAQKRLVHEYLYTNMIDDNDLNVLIDQSYEKRIEEHGIYISKNDYNKIALKIIETFQKEPFSSILSEKVWNLIHFNNSVLRKYFYRGAYGVLALLLLGAIALKRRKSILFLIPVIINLLSLFISVPATDFRYVFSLIFSIPLLFGLVMAPKDLSGTELKDELTDK